MLSLIITFATGIRKWAKHLVDFPKPKFVTSSKIQQWREILVDIYSHLCMTDESFKAALIDTEPRPFSLQCAQAWGHVPIGPDTSALHHTAPHADVISDILIQVRVAVVTDSEQVAGDARFSSRDAASGPLIG